jgi:hypothetical protein
MVDESSPSWTVAEESAAADICVGNTEAVLWLEILHGGSATAEGRAGC